MLDVSLNRLMGSIPEELKLLMKLVLLNLLGNLLWDPIPVGLVYMGNFCDDDFSNSNLRWCILELKNSNSSSFSNNLVFVEHC